MYVAIKQQKATFCNFPKTFPEPSLLMINLHVGWKISAYHTWNLLQKRFP